MSQALAPMTLESFLEWERRQELRYEFDGVQPIAMTGGTVAHSIISTNIVLVLAPRLRGSGCRAFNSDVKIITTRRVRYPDAIVTCTKPDFGSDIVPKPVVVFEVLSPSTGPVDRIVKNEEYRLTPSIQHYVMLEPNRMEAIVYSREGDRWVGLTVTGTSTVDLPALNLSIELAEFYADAGLPDDTTEE
jgi:Uma2 family endonuclease